MPLLRGFVSSLRFDVRLVCECADFGTCHRPFSGRQFVGGAIPATADVGWNIADVLDEINEDDSVGLTLMLLL